MGDVHQRYVLPFSILLNFQKLEESFSCKVRFRVMERNVWKFTLRLIALNNYCRKFVKVVRVEKSQVRYLIDYF